MPDGFGGAPQGVIASDQQGGLLARIGAFLFGSRNRVLIVWAVVAAMALSGAAAYIMVKPLRLPLADARAYLAAASCLLWLPLLGLLLDPSANLASGPRLRLPVVSLFILAGLGSITVADHYNLAGVFLKSTANRVAFFSILATVFVVRAWNAVNFARHKSRNRRSAETVAHVQAHADATVGRAPSNIDQQIAQHRDAESLGALLASVFVVAIVVGAYFVGQMKAPELGVSLGVWIFVAVICVFAIVVFLDPIADTPFVKGSAVICRHTARRFSFLAAFYNWIDSGLVFIGAHVAGADHREWQSRYVVLGGTLTCLALMAWFLEPPWGLAPMALGVVVALSVSRLWSWVEEDRNIASITKFNPLAPQRVGFREDFRDETILGFLFVLILIPIGLMQAHQSRLFGDWLFQPENDADKRFLDPNNWQMWLGYFGFELAKALPIVDWADIYGLGPGSDSIKPTHPIGMHAVFMARATVDLILIAALLQALGIASRNRQQKALYAADQISRLDELVEKVELKKSISAADDRNGGFDVERPAKIGLIDFRRYEEARLREIYATSGEKSKARGFVKAIFIANRISPEPAIVTLETLAEKRRDELELLRTYDQAKRDHQSKFRTIEVNEIRTIMLHLRAAHGMESFKKELIAMGATLGSANERLELFTAIALPPDRDTFQYARIPATQEITKVASTVTSIDQIVETLRLISKYRKEAFGTKQHVGDEAEKALTDRLRDLGGAPKAPEELDDPKAPDA